MAIRLELPRTLAPRLQMHWHGAQAGLRRQFRTARTFAARTTATARQWVQGLADSVVARIGLRARAALRHLARLDAFEARYDDLVDLLCWAAKDGIHTDRDARYAELRAWMCVHYRPYSPRLRPYWQEPGAAALANACDPFETLFRCDNVDDFINDADGIAHLMRTRLALDEYRAALGSRLPPATSR